MIKRILTLLTLIAGLMLAATAYAGDPVYLRAGDPRILSLAKEFNASSAQTQFLFRNGAVYIPNDPANNGDDSLQTAGYRNVRSNKTSWLYLALNFNYFGYRDRSGVLHAWQADEARYDRSTDDYQLLISGRWLRVGIDVYQLN